MLCDPIAPRRSLATTFEHGSQQLGRLRFDLSLMSSIDCRSEPAESQQLTSIFERLRFNCQELFVAIRRLLNKAGQWRRRSASAEHTSIRFRDSNRSIDRRLVVLRTTTRHGAVRRQRRGPRVTRRDGMCRENLLIFPSEWMKGKLLR